MVFGKRVGGGLHRGGNERETNKTHLRFNDLQVSDLDTTRGEVGYLKLDVDRAFALSLSYATHTTSKSTSHAASMFIITLDGRKAEFGAHEEFFPSTELLDLPNDSRLFRRIVDGANIRPETRGVRIFGHRD